MQCHDIEQRLTSWLLGDLPETEANDVSQHVEQCDGCRAAMREIEPTLDLLRTALAAPSVTPERLSPAHRRRIENYGIQPESTPARPRVIKWLTVSHPQFAAVAALLLVGFFVVSALLMPAMSSSRSRAKSIYGLEGRGELLKGRTRKLERYLSAIASDAEAQSYGVQLEEIAELEEPPPPLPVSVTLFSQVPGAERSPAFSDTDNDGLGEVQNGGMRYMTINGSGLVDAQNVTDSDENGRPVNIAGSE